MTPEVSSGYKGPGPLQSIPQELLMRPVKRYGVNKRHSARKFRHNVSRTHPINMRGAPMRGGIRL